MRLVLEVWCSIFIRSVFGKIFAPALEENVAEVGFLPELFGSRRAPISAHRGVLIVTLGALDSVPCKSRYFASLDGQIRLKHRDVLQVSLIFEAA